MNQLFSILLVLLLAACNNSTTTNNREGTKVDSNSNKTLGLDSTKNQKERNTEKLTKAIKISLDTFSNLPKEIDGCSCSFYLSPKDQKEEKYIFVNDFAQMAFVSINGKIEKFILKEHQEGSSIYLYFNGTYYLETKITKTENDGVEVTKEEGILTLKKGSDTLVEKRFIGSCGC